MNLREKQAVETFEKIVAVAETLSETYSYEKLSVDKICETANISKGGFYHHFSSKEELIAILFGRKMSQEISRNLSTNIEEKDAFELLRIYMNTMMKCLEGQSQSTLARCWVAVTEHADRTHSIFESDFFEILQKIIVQGKREGSIRKELDDEFCLAYLTGTISGILLWNSVYDKKNFQLFVDKTLELIYQTLK